VKQKMLKNLRIWEKMQERNFCSSSKSITKLNGIKKSSSVKTKLSVLKTSIFSSGTELNETR